MSDEQIFCLIIIVFCLFMLTVDPLEPREGNSASGKNLCFKGCGRVKVDVSELLKSPRVQEQIEAVRRLRDLIEKP